MPTILHVLDRLSGAGPTRSMVALVKHMAALGISARHRVIALQREAYPIALVLARQAGIHVLLQPDDATVDSEVAEADIVQLHFWSNPTTQAWLRRDLPPCRLLVWLKIHGGHAPQVVTRALIDYADVVVGTTPSTAELPVFRDMSPERGPEVVHGLADFTRLRGLQPRPHKGFRVGYIGTVNFSKMHPSYVRMSAAVEVPGVRFVVCGGGEDATLGPAVRALGAEAKFEFRGYVENIGAVLETLDVFGYPLCEDTYATSEKSLQEAMYAGVPPVVFPHGGVRHLVVHGETGLVVNSEDEYRAAIEHLYHHPEERRRLGANARAYALREFDPERAARHFESIYGRMLAAQKRKHSWEPAQTPSPRGACNFDGARRFLEAVGDAAPQFGASVLASVPGDWKPADDRIARSSVLLSGGEGGIIHFRKHYPDDPYLRLWTGLVFRHAGRTAQADAEFDAAVALGLPDARVSSYRQRSGDIAS